MKVVLKKRSAPPPSLKMPVARTARPPAAHARVGDDTAWIKWVFIFVLAAAIVGAVVAYGVSRQRKEAATRRAQETQRTSAPAAPGQVPGGILGDFDMNAWCKEHEKDNPELQARRARMRGGRPPAPQPQTP